MFTLAAPFSLCSLRALRFSVIVMLEPPRWIRVYRNVYDASMCFVVNFMMLLIVTKWEKGPLFGNLDRNGHILRADYKEGGREKSSWREVWFTKGEEAQPAADGKPAVKAQKAKRVNFTAAQIGSRSERLFGAIL